MPDIILSIPLKPALLKRIDYGLSLSPYKNRLEFIRYLLDAAMTQYERDHDNVRGS